MASVPPAKLKAFLSTIKENLLEVKNDDGMGVDRDQPQDPSPSSFAAYSLQALLCLECAQRGVLVDYASDPNKVILEAVRSTAGKPLLDDEASGLPKPLLSALSVLHGRLAESLGSQIKEAMKLHSKFPFDMKTLRSVIQRSQDVQDHRLECLLLLLLAVQEGNTSSLTLQQQRYLFQILAEGCYYRATDVAPDAPPLWKRIVDLHTTTTTTVAAINSSSTRDAASQQYTVDNWRTVVALEHMQSIAFAKGNVKRAQELGLVLAEHVMSVDEFGAIASSSNTTTDDSFTLAKSFLETFIKSYRSTEPYLLLEATQKASQYLEQSAADHQYDNSHERLRRHLVALRILLGREQALIQQVANADYMAIKNRSITTSSSSSVSKKEVYHQARQKYLVEAVAAATMTNNDDGSSGLESQAICLRDAVLAATNLDDDDGHTDDSTGGVDTNNLTRIRQACLVLQQYLVRQQDEAKALACKLAKKKSQAGNKSLALVWRRLQDFTFPLLEHVLARVRSTDVTVDVKEAANMSYIQLWLKQLSSEHYGLLQQAVFSLMFTEWMLSGVRPSSSSISLPLLHLVYNMLQVMLEKEHDQNAPSKEAGFIQSSIKSSATSNRLQCAFRSAKAWIHLSDGSRGTTLAREIAIDAVLRLDDAESFGESDEFGMSYLEFLICWSGMIKEAWSFCIMSEARSIVAKARACVKSTEIEWGRPMASYEHALLDIALADAELGSVSGGLLVEAKNQFRKHVEIMIDDTSDSPLARLISSKCVFGVSVLVLQDVSSHESQGELQAAVHTKLFELDRMCLQNNTGPLYLWRAPSATSWSVHYHLAAGHQLLADLLLRNKQSREAQKVLEQAVKDSPNDHAALLSLGVFHLRMSFFPEADDVGALDRNKAAQAYLLRAAKADPSKASPFALLGYWYEHAGDTPRATGCYSKALLIDLSHPVAGRGLIRLKSVDSLMPIIANATSEIFTLNGWAWNALGLHKMMSEGSDDLAIISFVTALRCRDIVHPISDNLAYFYANPHQPCPPGLSEFVSVSTDLATCYRRAGRYTASIRCYESAIEAAADMVLSSTLCECAQVEFELGLLDEAFDKFSKAIRRNEHTTLLMASYGLGLTLLAIAGRNLQDGKAGAAMDAIERGIATCISLMDQPSCLLKLIGDLHTFTANLPPDVVSGGDSDTIQTLSTQIYLVSCGVDYYRRAEIATQGMPAEESKMARACLASDIGCNLLLQSQILANHKSCGLGFDSPEANDCLLRAEEAFTSALKICPEYAPAWCGLGCSLRRKDPLLSQHAFSKSIELDTLSPDAYSNLSFLYTFRNSVDASKEMIDAVTKIADTPYMWINRALLAEREAAIDTRIQTDPLIQKAADAYRAALQVSSTSAAKEGLAFTCRVENEISQDMNMHHLLSEYQALTGMNNIPTAIFHGLSSMEIRLEGLIEEGKAEFFAAVSKLEEVAQGSTNATLESLHVDNIVAAVSNDNSDVNAVSTQQVLQIDARQVFYEPEKGEKWIGLAKHVLTQIEPTSEQLQTARRLLRKGRHILGEATTRNVTKAEDYSDVLALEYWLDYLSGEPLAHEDFVGVQKSLLLNPSNMYAREALRTLKH